MAAALAAMLEISRLGKQLNDFDRELGQLEMKSGRIIYPKGGEENNKNKEEERRQSLTSKLDAWNLSKQSFIKDTLRPNLLSHLSYAHKTLDLHHMFLTLDLDSRLQTLTAKINDEQELLKDEHDIKRTVVVKTIATSRDLLSEAKQDLEDEAKEENATGNKKTLSLWLKENEKDPHIPSEWKSLFDLRATAVHAAILLSKLLARFRSSLSGKEEEKLESLVSRIKKSGIVAENFVSVVYAAKHEMPQGKGEEISKEDGQVLEKVVSQFCEAILHLQFLLCGACVPDTWTMVRGARVKLEVVLGQILCSVQWIKLRVICMQGNKNSYSDEHWETMKDFIAGVWKLEKLCN